MVCTLRIRCISKYPGAGTGHPVSTVFMAHSTLYREVSLEALVLTDFDPFGIEADTLSRI